MGGFRRERSPSFFGLPPAARPLEGEGGEKSTGEKWKEGTVTKGVVSPHDPFVSKCGRGKEGEEVYEVRKKRVRGETMRLPCRYWGWGV